MASQNQVHPNQALQLVNDVLEKLIDSQITNAKAISELKSAVEKNIETTKENAQALQRVIAFFSNGFKKELKDYISEEMLCHDHYQEFSTKFDNLLEKYNKQVEEMGELQAGYQEALDKYSVSVITELTAVRQHLSRFHTTGFWVKMLATILIASGSLFALWIKLR